MDISGQKASLPHLWVVLRVMFPHKAIPFLSYFFSVCTNARYPSFRKAFL